MGTGGPTALKTLTQVLVPHFRLELALSFPSLSLPLSLSLYHRVVKLEAFVFKDELGVSALPTWCTSGDSNPGPTD